MARLIRAHPWRKSPLGRIENWPETLLNSVNVILAMQWQQLT
jgi:hypothetical protein